MADAAQIFALLAAIARDTTQAAMPLPAQEQPADSWRGLAFNVGGNRLLSVIGDVEEVIDVPPRTRVPGTVKWLLGIANVRGRLLMVVDLCAYLGLGKSAPEEDWRVLVVDRGELLVGLLVEQALGMMQFEDTEGDAAADVSTGTALDPYLGAGFRQSGRRWRVVDLVALVDEPAFREVAA